MTRPTRTRTRGFSLIEVMVALAVISVTGAGSLSLMAAMFKQNADSRKMAAAGAAGRHTLDNLMSLTAPVKTNTGFYTAVNSAASPLNGAGCASGASCTASCTGTACSNDPTYQGISRTVTMDPNTTEGLHPVTIAFTWQTSGRTRRAVFNTMLARPTP